MRLILLSGGIDSVAAGLVSEADSALFVDYGQVAARKELQSARILSALTGWGFHVATVSSPGIPAPDSVGVIPARNALLLTIAISLVGANGGGEVVHGAAGADQAGFVDCRKEFFDLMRSVAAPWGVSILTPLIDKPRQDIIWNVPEKLRAYTWSCYTAGPIPCGECLSCLQ